jgi:hypothetical protein
MPATVQRIYAVFLPRDELQQILQARIAYAKETQAVDRDENEDCDAERL